MIVLHGSSGPRKQPGPQEDERFRLKKVFASFSSLPRILRLVWETSPQLLLGMAFFTLLSGFLPLATVILARLLIDSALHAIAVGSLTPLLLPIGLQLGLGLLDRLLTSLNTLTQALLQDRVSNHIQLLILRQANRLDLAFFEDSDSYDTLRYASQESLNRPISMIDQAFNLIRALITLSTLLGLLLSLSWWLALVALIIPLPSFIASSRYGLKNYWMLRFQSPEKRRQLYLNMLLTTDEFNKEIKLFNLGAFLIRRYEQLAERFYRESKKLQVARNLNNVAWSALTVLASSAIYLYVALLTVQRVISLGALSQYTLAINQAGQSFQSALNEITGMYENSLYIKTLFEFLNYQPKIVSPPVPVAMPTEGNGVSIEFRNVTFTYPGKTEAALKGISFTLRAGETIALVGRNGAGKTTLVKLLTRLYDPDEGEILIDGRNIKDYDLRELRERIGVIFQDYVKYNFTAHENIGVGSVMELENRALVEAAARKSGADAVIERLDEGYEAMLGHWFDSGAQLSGGEWQKIALARAFMRNASLLILDEPTSALDAQAEYEVFTGFRRLTGGKSAIFISHRFSTVRLADRIFVIEHGTLVESGSHEDLMALDGRYAELFNVQAEAYR